eukprot:CAMPEP_0194714984 /NCGR_PEP_ID=MMETSP0296-20130528/6684_1 /TAXON_ID=39354 /ORGANISM="Heterosigma akashiwo, Strain CCMP2393" /LENGTH=76 /DNA_ID=CAMNT_0039614509 /DNA_START=80 /DNA_END=308 /DNA_ORIENTATION=-
MNTSIFLKQQRVLLFSGKIAPITVRGLPPQTMPPHAASITATAWPPREARAPAELGDPPVPRGALPARALAAPHER